MLTCVGEPGDPGECPVTVLILKQEGGQDSMVVSQTGSHDCSGPQFFWSKSVEYLVVETNDRGCDGQRRTQVFDLKKQHLLYTVDGNLWLFDDLLNIAILQTDSTEFDANGRISKRPFKLFAYDIVRNEKWPIFSIDGYAYDCTGDNLSIEFDQHAIRTLSIQTPASSETKTTFSVRY